MGRPLECGGDGASPGRAVKYTDADMHFLRELQRALEEYRGDTHGVFFVTNTAAIVSDRRWP